MEERRLNSGCRAFYIFRIDYDDGYETILDELSKGILRQGWGRSGMDISNSLEQFTRAWMDHWGENDADKIKSRYNNLRTMLEFKAGDIIIIPKVPNAHSFAIYEVTGDYYFREDKRLDLVETDDYRHCIPIKVIMSGVEYESNHEAQIISKTFRAYRHAINHIKTEEVIEAIERFLHLLNENQAGNWSDLPEVVGGILGRMVGDVRSGRADGRAPEGGIANSGHSGTINMIPSSFLGSCWPILVTLCYDQDDFEKRIFEGLDLAVKNCPNVTRSIFFLTTQWDSEVVQKLGGYIESVRKRNVEIQFIYTTAKGTVRMPV